MQILLIYESRITEFTSAFSFTAKAMNQSIHKGTEAQSQDLKHPMKSEVYQLKPANYSEYTQ